MGAGWSVVTAVLLREQLRDPNVWSPHSRKLRGNSLGERGRRHGGTLRLMAFSERYGMKLEKTESAPVEATPRSLEGVVREDPRLEIEGTMVTTTAAAA